MEVNISQKPFDRLWHPEEAATYLGIHEKTAIKMARQRRIPALRVGKHWRFRREDLVLWVGAQVQSTCQPAE